MAWLVALLEAFGRLGLDGSALCRAADLDPGVLGDPDRRISRDSLGRLWRAALRQSDDALLGLHAGERTSWRVNHLVSLLLFTAPTFGEGLRSLIRYQAAFAHGRLVSLEGRHGRFRVRVRRLETALPILDQEHDYLVVALLKLFQTATSPDFRFRKVELVHSAQGPVQEYERVFGCPVTFGAQATELHLDDAWMDSPLRHANPALYAQLQLLAAGRSQPSSQESLAADVGERLQALLPLGECGIDEVASAMRTTARTLQRRLAEEGTCFREVFDATRRRILVLCIERGCSAEEMLRFGGFTDRRALRRALTRWSLEPAEGSEPVHRS